MIRQLKKMSGSLGVFETQSRKQKETAPKIARALMILIASFLIFVLVWSAKTEMRVIVRAEGEIAPLGEIRRVDHFDGGVVAEILVTEGSTVTANQPLARVEDPSLQGNIAELEAELAYLNEEISNLAWLLEGHVTIGVSRATEVQYELFVARQKMMKYRAERLAESAQIAEDLLDNARQQLSLSESSLQRIQMLYDRGVISQSNLLIEIEEAEGARAEYLRADSNYSKARLDASVAKAEKDEAYLAYQEEHLDALNDLERSRKLAQVRLVGLKAQKRRQVVRAPESGVIQSSFTTTIGEVVPAGGTLFELLPSNEQLVAIVKIDPKDVGHVQVGSSVVVRVATFDSRRYGEVRGSIDLISPTSIVPR